MDTYVQATNREYNLDEPRERRILRFDLEEIGFFKVDGYQKFYGYFDRNLKREELTDLMNSIKLFGVYKNKGNFRN